jgi:hypothetical protein
MGPLIGLGIMAGKALLSAATTDESAYGNHDFFSKFADSLKHETVDKDGDGKVSIGNAVEGAITVASGMGFMPGGSIPGLDIAGGGGNSLLSSTSLGGGGLESTILGGLFK